MSEMIESQNELFPGKMIPKPPLATVIDDARGEPIYICPHCKASANANDCDCIGAEPYCLFCNKCGGEFEVP